VNPDDPGDRDDATPPAPAGAEASDIGADEQALLDAFDRLSPQGGLRWGFDDAMRRIEEPEADGAPGAEPWKGLPDDLWERGRSARVGQRLVGDVAGVMADILAADARAAAQASAGVANVAVWDALRYLSARVERLEARIDPLGLEAAELPVPVAEPGEWAAAIPSWIGSPRSPAPVVVGESGDGGLLTVLAGAGHAVVGIEPRAAVAWPSLSRDPSGASGDASTGAGPADVVLAEVAEHLATMGSDGAAGVVLLGCVDRLDVAGQLDLVAQSVRIVEPGGTIVVLTTDQTVWAGGLPAPARDLAPGRPLHPETWTLLMHRAGAVDIEWHRPVSGDLHAVVARLEP
jgi:hypothetical protein